MPVIFGWSATVRRSPAARSARRPASGCSPGNGSSRPGRRFRVGSSASGAAPSGAPPAAVSGGVGPGPPGSSRPYRPALLHLADVALDRIEVLVEQAPVLLVLLVLRALDLAQEVDERPALRVAEPGVGVVLPLAVLQELAERDIGLLRQGIGDDAGAPLERGGNELPAAVVVPREVVAVSFVEPGVRRHVADRVVDVLVEGLVIEHAQRVALVRLVLEEHQFLVRRAPVSGRSAGPPVAVVLRQVLADAYDGDRRHLLRGGNSCS